MEKINVVINKPSLKYRCLLKLASSGNKLITKYTLKNINKIPIIQKSYKTNIFKTWLKGFKQKYIHGIQTFVYNEKKENCLVYFHGGAYISNPMPQHFKFLKKLANQINFKIYFVMYPHLPSYNCEQSINLLSGWFKEIPENNIVLGGDSSGGGLALALYKYLTDNNLKNILKIFTLSPWLDVSLNNIKIKDKENLDKILNLNNLKILGKLWSKQLNENNYMHSPKHITDIKNNTSHLIISGSHEILAPDIEEFSNNNKNSNILWYEFDKMQHVFMLYPCKEAKKAFSKVKNFLLNDKF